MRVGLKGAIRSIRPGRSKHRRLAAEERSESRPVERVGAFTLSDGAVPPSLVAETPDHSDNVKMPTCSSLSSKPYRIAFARTVVSPSGRSIGPV